LRTEKNKTKTKKKQNKNKKKQKKTSVKHIRYYTLPPHRRLRKRGRRQTGIVKRNLKNMDIT